ncbi:OsmC family protein [Nesterenkonia sphaerica]|uniref:OsmC family protein n=1 Tax=Nesterenkonia sphaerica TaxID=1804988 RepID=A0A5R9AEF6_9MICC|nr:OsmC family protein [Nesterenkonia sphaerica]TLP77091.1 OsmC family protein [Nesterenkonia sphaerica]
MSETTAQLVGVDAQGLEELSLKNRENPSQGHKVIRTRTVAESGFRNLNHVRGHQPFLISEPHKLLGDDEAPNPTEFALGALGSCISVGLMANATHRGVRLTKIEVDLEGEIDISATWGTGDLDPEKVLGVSHVRVNVILDGDADRATLEEITDNAIKWSPVVNTFTRPATFETRLSVGDGAGG